MDSTEPIKVPFFKKGKLRPTTARRRSVSPSSAPEPLAATTSKSQVVLPSRKTQANLLTAGTKRTIAQRDEEEEQGTREGPGVEWTASGSHVNTALEIIAGDEVEELMEKKNKKASEVPKSMRIGPQRSTNTIRTVTIVDYQPDVCKDYKGAVFCSPTW
jgi:RING finger protein 113A